MINKRTLTSIIFKAITIALISSTYNSHHAYSSGFELVHSKKCGDTAVLIVPEPGIKKEAYVQMENYFHSFCWDTYFLSYPEGTSYGLNDITTSIINAFKSIVSERFVSIVHGYASIPFIRAALISENRTPAAFLSPVFSRKSFSRAFTMSVLFNNGHVQEKDVSFVDLQETRIKGFRSKLPVPYLLFFPRPEKYHGQNPVKQYLSSIPRSIVQDLAEFYEKNTYGKIPPFNEKTVVSYLNVVKPLILHGHVDSVAPYYMTYRFLLDHDVKFSFVLLSIVSFKHHNYGHLDSLIDKHSDSDVFKEIYRWAYSRFTGHLPEKDIPF